MAGFFSFFKFLRVGLLDAQAFDSVGLSLISAESSTGSVDAYLFESKVEVVFQLHFQILMRRSRLISWSGGFAASPTFVVGELG